ncbi:MAG TPA: OadG family protein [Candidatus Eubacterium faecigallinarum]|nr:OadG family protein [Candidatus Eubacterium faecigallinarum]
MAVSINADSWKNSLPVVLFGMVGIFIVIGVIVLLTYLLNKVTSKSSKKKDKNKDE